LQDLAKRYEAKDQKCNELRDRLKVTKAALSSKERDLDMAQRLLQKLGQEKAHLRVRVQLQLHQQRQILVFQQLVQLSDNAHSRQSSCQRSQQQQRRTWCCSTPRLKHQWHARKRVAGAASRQDHRPAGVCRALR
jgi:chromosome segregation ATPase